MKGRLMVLGLAFASVIITGCGDPREVPPGPGTRQTAKALPLQRLPDEGGVALDPNPVEVRKGQVVYVPAYSHIYVGNGQRYLMAVTLSIRNTSPTDAVVVKSVRYYDSGGNLVKEATEGQLRLGPMATVEYLIPERDPSGGSGANFVVEWVSSAPEIAEPIFETVMVTTHSQGISFSSRGRVIREWQPKGSEASR